jgi:imidazoleglycerol phosphate dehydratase HisB
MSRTATVSRRTRETDISCTLNLDGSGEATIATGIGFLDHLFTALARHGGFDLELSCRGDLHIDDHHTAEDCSLVLGEALRIAVGDKRGIARFGHAYAPMDETLARAVVDLSGRPWPVVKLGLQRPMIGTLACENVVHVFNSLAMAAAMNLHVEVLYGENDHHKAEGSMKALALALKAAVRVVGGEVPSTKGVL